MKRPEEWSGVGSASVLTDHSGQVVLHSLQYVERCNDAVEYCVAVVQPGRDDAIRDGLGKVVCQCVAWWLSGRALDLRFTGRGFNPSRWLSRNIGKLSFASLHGH